jgi:hypothetical protein
MITLTLTPTQEEALTGFIGERLGEYESPELLQIYDLLVGPTLPCDKCGDRIDKDIHAEELGMCVDCSHDYFDHKEN